MRRLQETLWSGVLGLTDERGSRVEVAVRDGWVDAVTAASQAHSPFLTERKSLKLLRGSSKLFGISRARRLCWRVRSG